MQDTAISLTALQNKISGALKSPDFKDIWVIAEISQLTDKGFMYLELVENKDNVLIAKQSAIIWPQQAKHIKNKFLKGSQIPLQKDIEVMIKVTIEHKPLHGLKYIITDINPVHTVGRLQLKIQQIKDYLVKQNAFQLNKQHELPKYYQRVAVITPGGSAGEADFKKDADILEKYNICQFTYYHATMQGPQAEEAMASAIVCANKEHAINPFDALVVIRGGGASADLSWLNNHKSALYICHSKMPVITGLGHEIDTCILDEIAKRDAGTPSKTIELITKTNINAINSLGNIITNYKNSSSNIIEKSKTDLFQKDINLRRSFKHTLLRTKMSILAKEHSVTQNIFQKMKLARKNIFQSHNFIETQFRQQLRQHSENIRNKIIRFKKENKSTMRRLKSSLSDKNNLLHRAVITLPARMVKSLMRQLNTFNSIATSIPKKQRLTITTNAEQIKLNIQRLHSNGLAKINNKSDTFKQELTNSITRQGESLTQKRRQFILTQPLNTLKRGYAIVRDPNNDLVKNTSDANKHETLHLDFQDKSITVQTTGKTHDRITPEL